jgi:hypothetical protein
MQRSVLVAVGLVFTLSICVDAQSSKAKAKTKAKSSAAAPEKPKYKGIFEAVSYPDDIRLESVLFLDDKRGWAAGVAVSSPIENRGGVIIKTVDGGENWTIDAGDPQAPERGFDDLRAADEHTLFARQAAKLWRHQNGRWLPVGEITSHTRDFEFLSAMRGISIYGDDIEVTDDAGKKWRKVGLCAPKIMLEGLARNARCELRSLQFPTESVGYAVGYSNDDKENRHFILMKTTDGGETWSTRAIEGGGDWYHDAELAFVDENVGFVRHGSKEKGILYKTTDGGGTWTQVGTSPGEKIKFADERVGWSFLYNKWGFTTDGGERWTTRELKFPATVLDFSMPQSDLAYIVGEHGMVFRYRVVPYEYKSAKHVVESMAMPKTAGD